MQKWRAKHGPKATYRNLAKSFYDAGERSLVETVCEVVTHISSTDKVTDILLSTHSVVQMVNIVGLPAVGKSTLAIHTGYEMTSHGVAVRYKNLDETRIFKSHDDLNLS